MQLAENISLKKYNSFGIDVMARYFATVETVEAFTALPDKILQASLILGGGSNILFTKDVDGYVLKNNIKAIEKTGEDETHVFIKAGAGENWHRFVSYCLEHHYAGVENLALIPGSIGASPMQNIGAYGVEVKDVIHTVDTIHIEDKAPVVFSNADCGFGYRESVFKNKFRNQFIITGVTYKLSKQPGFKTSYGAIEEELARMKVTSLSIQAIAQAVINIRTSKLPDPAVIGNAGSFFKNPEISSDLFTQLKSGFPAIVGYPLENGKVKLAAGWLIEQCGWKGYRNGDAGCHAKQALVLVNYGNATGEAIFDLSGQIIRSVQDKFGITLDREVNIF